MSAVFRSSSRRSAWLGGLLALCLPATLALTPSTASAAASATPDRDHLGPGIQETQYTIRTGPGPHDRIRLHHVVRTSHGRPVPTDSAVLLLHGDAWDYDAAFGRSDPRRSMPAYLARHGVDVWGLDLAWTLVPGDVEDIDFMAEWGLQHDIDDVRRALAFARSVRARTGDGRGRLTLAGWSRGGWIGYALLSQEAGKPAARRQVGSFIPIDTVFKTHDPVVREAQCAIADENDGYLEAADYAYDFSGTAEIGRLAETDPDGESPIFGPPYTNKGASLSFGAAGFQNGTFFSPWYHFVAGTFPGGDTARDPDGLRLTDLSEWDDFVVGVSTWEPVRLIAEAARITCDDGTTTRFDAHLDDIRVPILYVGAAGGIGTYGVESMRRTDSRDAHSVIARTLPRGQEKTDVGHVDLFRARDAQRFTWGAILHWLEEHPTGAPHQ